MIERFRGYVLGMVLVGGYLSSTGAGISMAEDWVHTGMAEKGRITAGFRVGPNFTTQDGGVSTVGPSLNFQGMYGLNQWFRAGMMLEWERHGLDGQDGTLNTISILPAVLEFRPGHIGPFVPYLTTGIGVNVNTKDVDNTFAWRVGGGIDYPLTQLIASAPKGLMLNVETAWKRNRPDAELSTIGLLFGVRHTY